MAKTINDWLNDIEQATFGSQVRTAIIKAITECYENVTSSSLREDAFYNALQTALADKTLSSGVLEGLGYITEKSEVNLFDFTEIEEGVFDSSGNVIDTVASHANYWCGSAIEVEPNVKYFCSGLYAVAIFSDSGLIRILYNTNTNTIVMPVNASYIRVCLLKTRLHSVEVNKGDNFAYEPGRSPVDFNLRKRVYTKNEADALYLLTESQISELIGLLD